MASVLIVDDEPSIRLCLGEFLGAEGHEIFSAENGLEAIGIIAEHPIDVVVSDICMPGFSGTDLLQHLHKGDDEIQVILITGLPTLETASIAIRYQAFAYLEKPFRGMEVCQTVAAAYRVKHLKEEKRRLDGENQRILRHLEELVQERTDTLAQANADLLQEIQVRTRVQDELRTSHSRLEKNLDQTTRALSLAIEKRDFYTAGHQARVAVLATAIGQAMSLPKDLLETIHTAASLHDVGKISVPAEILAKPTVLDAAEMALIQKHPLTGWEIVCSIDFPGPVAEIILQHHERLDGSGYPKGLSGSSILLEAQIVAIADIVEAMTHHRPYREAMGLKASLEYVAEREQLFGPRVSASCLAVFNGGFIFPKV